ncbi:RICIN domain-containing protein [Streptomyces johnsoniae]|uniref:XRE family transcriptional regulator n=1 Tax=Streptomyces johnsoniae TaxID=3075532 RepID=A0ABU2SD84_9ACTN|nr:XRE family transcriptional regulator [Streptomyces sp. DSM 41886]MDT0446626.1 XRE family transcriptional regulator [Streptomyces sp. DSM 41886]
MRPERRRNDPAGLATPEEFIDALRALKNASGLTFRELTERAAAVGHSLPTSTLAGSLTRTSLPSAAVVTGLVRACGGTGEDAERWLAARTRIAIGAAAPDEAEDPDEAEAEPAEPAEPDEPPRPAAPTARRHRRRLLTAAAAGGLIVAGLGGVLAVGSDDESRDPVAEPTPESADQHVPPLGDVLLRPAHTGMCLTEGRERNGRTDRPLLVQRECATATAAPPRLVLQQAAEGTYQLLFVHPDHGPGCLTVDQGGQEDGRLLAPHDCNDGLPHQRFVIEPMDVPTAGGYRIMPAHGDKCLGFIGPVDEEGAEVAQMTCVGTADQQFLIEAAD